MKNSILIMVVLFMSYNFIEAQEQNQNLKPKDIQTVFGNEFTNSGYLGISTKYSMIAGEPAFDIGGRFVWTVNKSFSIGLKGNSINSSNQFEYRNIYDTLNTDVKVSYGGLFLEYIYNPQKYLHFSANTTIGIGSTILKSQDNNYYYVDPPNYYYYDAAQASFFVVEPSVAVEINVTTNFRIGAEASYKFINVTNENDSYKKGYEMNRLKYDGFSAGLVFQFGWF